MARIVPDTMPGRYGPAEPPRPDASFRRALRERAEMSVTKVARAGVRAALDGFAESHGRPIPAARRESTAARLFKAANTAAARAADLQNTLYRIGPGDEADHIRLEAEGYRVDAEQFRARAAELLA